MFLNGYPYTDFHEMNLDFLLQSMDTLKKAFKDFTASNSLIFAEPLQHDLTQSYAKNTIVLDPDGNAYISLQAVPEGVQLSNADYWLMVFNFEDYTEKANKNFTVNYFRDTTRSDRTLAVGDWVVLDDVLYTVTQAIAADGLFIIGTNLTHFTVEQFLKDFVTSINQTVLQYKNDIDASEYAYRQQLAQDIADTTATLQAQLNLAISGATVDSEVINARLGNNNITYATLGDAIRKQIEDIKIGYNTDFIDNINYLRGTPIDDYYCSYASGTVAANVGWSYYPQIIVRENERYVANQVGAHVAFFDSTGTYISGVLTSSSNNPDFPVPAGAAYMTYSYQRTNGSPYLLKTLSSELKYFSPELKKLDRNVSVGYLNLRDIVQTGNNLFNDYDVIEGYSIDYTNASMLWKNALYCYSPSLIPVEASSSYWFSNMAIIGEYDKDGNAVAVHNFTAGTYASGGTFTTDADAAYVLIGCRTEHRHVFIFTKGSSSIPYEKYYLSFIGTSPSFNVNILTVGADGTKMYSSIGDAITAANTDDVILVYPGTYEETLNAYSKRVHIIGTNKKLCVLTYSGYNYSTPPLHMAAGSVRNMTINATATGVDTPTHAYCVHIDNDNEEDQELLFDNVDFNNECWQAVGIGLRKNFTLIFNNCNFYSNGYAGLYCHDWETNSAGDKSGQKLVVKNCTINSNSSSNAAIMLQSQELQTACAECTFKSNVVIQQGSGGIIRMVLWAGRTLTNDQFMGSSDWVLSIDSALNNESAINK